MDISILQINMIPFTEFQLLVLQNLKRNYMDKITISYKLIYLTIRTMSFISRILVLSHSNNAFLLFIFNFIQVRLKQFSFSALGKRNLCQFVWGCCKQNSTKSI